LAADWRSIESRFAGSGDGHPGDRIRARLAEARSRHGDAELRYTIADPWEHRLFVAVCSRYGLIPFRRPRMHATTILVKAPESFFQDTIWAQFTALADMLREHLRNYTDEAIRIAICNTVTPTPGQGPPVDVLDLSQVW